MSKNYDNWERLVKAVLLRKKLREIALQDSMSFSSIATTSSVQKISLSDSISSDFSFRLNSTHFSAPDDSSIVQQDFLSLARSKTEKRTENKIVRMEGCNFSCSVEDFLSASTKVLGSGTFRINFSERRTSVVRKILKDLKETSGEELEKEIQFLGSIRHQNIVPLIAYVCSEETLSLVYDFAGRSLQSMLHDKTGEEPTWHMDWETRQRIAIGTARGLAHIHTQNDRKLIHGNIKASNIFLNLEKKGCISEITIHKYIHRSTMWNTGYRAPETQVSQASDVYSFGIVLLELLTRKSPDQRARLGNKVLGLVSWVNCVASMKGTSKVFDPKIVMNPTIEEQMVKMLLVGMLCVARKPEQRPKMRHLLKMME